MLGIDEWIVRLVKVIYDGANTRVRVNCCFVLSPLLSRECCIGCSEELLHEDDLVMSDNLEDLKIQLQAWKTSLDTQF